MSFGWCQEVPTFSSSSNSNSSAYSPPNSIWDPCQRSMDRSPSGRKILAKSPIKSPSSLNAPRASIAVDRYCWNIYNKFTILIIDWLSINQKYNTNKNHSCFDLNDLLICSIFNYLELFKEAQKANLYGFRHELPKMLKDLANASL